MRILAVDDSATMRELLGSTLAGAGYEVVLAGDGQEALEQARRQVSDLVITDLHMPRLDGISLVRELRQLDDYRLVPMLMLTTETQAVMKQQAKGAGATGWIVKPFEPSRLLQTLKRLLG